MRLPRTSYPAMSQETRVYRQELLPTHFLERAGDAYAEHIAVVDGEVEYTWREFRARARRFGSSLKARGLEKEDRVAFLALNSEPLLLAHFGVPLAGGTLVSINTRLSPDEIGYIIEQSGSTTVFYSPELRDRLPSTLSGVELLDTQGELEDLLSQGTEDEVPTGGFHEDETITINYTSGTTGRPKGVMYHHRGAYLNALAMVLDQRLTADSVYLWTLPMFHCNGWTFAWGVAAVGAKSVCIPRIDPGDVWRRFDEGCHALLRRTHGAHHARQRSGRPPARATGAVIYGRCATLAHDHRSDGRPQFRARAYIWPDGDVRPVHDQRRTTESGELLGGGAVASQGTTRIRERLHRRCERGRCPNADRSGRWRNDG